MNESHDIQAPETVIELRDVSVSALKQPRLTLLEEVNWVVARGDYWAVGGLHASGKTDFLAMLAGLVPPVRGTYHLLGHELKAGYLDEMLGERMRLGIVFDGGQLFSRMTVRENIALPLRYHFGAEGTEERVAELLMGLELEEMADRLPNSITQGWRQRAGLARALALKPEILLLDTPLTGLDPRHINWWLGTLDQLFKGHALMNGRPLTLVVTCDDLRPWRSRATRFAILKSKHLIHLGGRMDLVGETEILAGDLLIKDFHPE